MFALTCQYCRTGYERSWSNANRDEQYCSVACEMMDMTGSPERAKQLTKKERRAAAVLIPAQARTYRTGGS